MSGDESIDVEKLEKLIVDAKASGGSEMANFQSFVKDLTKALGLQEPNMSVEENQYNDYVFERRVDFKHPDGSRSLGRIDCYKKNAFVMEGKQSAKRLAKVDAAQLSLLAEDERQKKSGQAKRGTRGWDQVMLAARKQAEDYAKALPTEHGYPPFLLIVDVGNVIEIYADFSGLGKDYAQFPDRLSYRISMDDLRNEDVQTRLKAIWTNPQSLNPAKRSAEVTSDIAARLARIAKSLEGKHEAKDVAEFLMRCLFTMFAEDVELIPAKTFETLLKELKGKPAAFVPALEALWKAMDEGGYEQRNFQTLKRFNGGLFKKRTALPLEPDQIHELYAAAQRTWQDVEPAIFGTLLERALDPRERSKLGAHYTPRAYVERLVIPTIIEPLRADWEEVKAQVEDQRKMGAMDGALQTIKNFHHKLCTTRVLDPACGTGNFLYVALEMMKRLEGDVLEALDAFGEKQSNLMMEGETVSPRQFYGLELNPRAVPVADLVLWIGYLKWQLKTIGLASISEPVLHAYGTIKHQDAVISYDKQELLRDAQGKPLSRWDGVTKKLHPITGEEIPDPDAKLPLYSYTHPRIAPWPEVEFIVGNPPFIGGKDMRQELGDGYAEACWKARPLMAGGADFVMHFWDEAARRLTAKGTAKAPNPLQRFGFITTNKITQIFSRRTIERYLISKEPFSLVFAIPDHPWPKAPDKAAVRIAMSVAERGVHEGVLAKVTYEAESESEAPEVDFSRSEGKITARLTIGADFSKLNELTANSQVGHKGFMPYGMAFWIDEITARQFGLGKVSDAEKYIRKYINGRDLNQKTRGRFVLDFHGKSEDFVRQNFPQAYQHLLTKSEPIRRHEKMKYRRENWWRFGQPSTEMRSALENLNRYFGTTETAKHRIFSVLDGNLAPDQKIRVIACSSWEALSVLSSRTHIEFSFATGGWQGVGNDPVYQHTQTFDPFPFPACITDQSNPALRQRLSDLGERLDGFRKERLAAHDFLTMTALYNVLERVRELENGCAVEPLSPAERDIYDAGLISILKEIHDDIDRATFEAYGWQDLGERLIGKPGATVPSVHKSEDQEQAEEELLTRLVALNLERQEEEKRGLVRWLRPDYQIAKLGAKVAKPTSEEQLEADVGVITLEVKPKWPSDGLAQIRIVRDVLSKVAAPAAPDEIALAFDGRNSPTRKDRVRQVLETLVATGAARTADEGGKSRYFVAR
jgi:hypothetical protein